MNELLTVIANEFWPLLLVLTLLIMKPYRLGGIVLLAARCVNGRFDWYVIAFVGIICVFTDWFFPAFYYNNKLKEMQQKDRTNQPDRNDPESNKRR